MNLTYCGIILNIMIVLLRIERNTLQYNDLVDLQYIAGEFNSSESANIDGLLKVFRDKTHLRVSLDDLYVYFSNMGIFKV